MEFTERNVFQLFLLSIFTLGIYYIFWTYDVSNQLKRIKNDNREPRTEVILGIITLRFYYIYWHYKTAKEVYELAQDYGYIGIQDQSKLCAFISFFFMGDYMSMGLIQTNLNTINLLSKRENLALSK